MPSTRGIGSKMTLAHLGIQFVDAFGERDGAEFDLFARIGPVDGGVVDFVAGRRQLHRDSIDDGFAFDAFGQLVDQEISRLLRCIFV